MWTTSFISISTFAFLNANAFSIYGSIYIKFLNFTDENYFSTLKSDTATKISSFNGLVVRFEVNRDRALYSTE